MRETHDLLAFGVPDYRGDTPMRRFRWCIAFGHSATADCLALPLNRRIEKSNSKKPLSPTRTNTNAPG